MPVPPSAQRTSTGASPRVLPEVTNEALFEALCQGGPDAVVVVRRDGEIVFANLRCSELLGYAPGELVGQSVELLVPEELVEHVQARGRYLSATTARPMGKRPLVTARHKSGATIPVDVALSPLPLDAGEHGPLIEAVLRDATHRWSTEQHEVLQSVAMVAAANGIIITDAAGVIEWVNPAATRMTGFAADEMLGQHTRMLKSGEHDAGFYRTLWETVLAGRTWYGEMANRRKDGTIYYEEQHISPVVREDGQVTHFVAIKQDVTARRLAEAQLLEANAELSRKLAEIEALHHQLREEAIRDPLTGLFNRRYLRETMGRELARAHREQRDTCVAAMDIDNFKPLNDSLGHAAGDAVLVLLADILTSSVRDSDIPTRMGGDELLVFMPGAPLEAAERRARAWSEAFRDRQLALGDLAGGHRCTLSIGVVHVSDPRLTADELLKLADEALYEAKSDGRDRVVARNGGLGPASSGAR